MAKLSRFSSIKVNMIVYSLSIIMLMTILSLYSLSIMERYKGQIEGMFEKHIYLSEIEEIMDELDVDLLGFLSSKSSTRLNEYLINIETLKQLVEDTPQEAVNNEELMMINIATLVDKYMEQGNEAISYKRSRNVAEYYASYEQSVQIKGFIHDYIDQLNNRQLNRNSKSYLGLVNQIRLLQTITYLIVFVLILISFIVVYFITARMVKPFSNLSHAAEEIAKGNLETEDIVVETEDEFFLLATAFNRMKNSISQYVEELTLQAETEAKLKDEQLKNVKMEHLLDNAKLYALQSQINPHFLFNTINAGVQLSIIERAPKTGQFLETMSRLFRYNIQKMDSSCTLAEEIANIRDYYELLQVRFGERIQFQFHLDTAASTALVPPLILQPLVENAYIHGLSGLEEGGKIEVSTLKMNERIIITVKDNGKGYQQEMFDRILRKPDTENPNEGRTMDDEVGIGIRNVRDRLELFFHESDIFRMYGEVSRGVKVIMDVPYVVREQRIESEH